MAAKIRKGDTVVILAGKDRGQSGEVTRVDPKTERAIVQGKNMVKRHNRPSQFSEGGVVQKEASIHLSNLALADPKDGKPTRVGFKVEKDGSKARIAKRSGEVISEAV